MSGNFRVNKDGSITRDNNDYTVNDDGSVTQNGQKPPTPQPPTPPNPPSNNTGCIWITIIIVIIIGVVALVGNNFTGTTPTSEDSDSVYEVIEVPVSGYSAKSSTTPNSSGQYLSESCSWKRMDNVYGGYMLVPDFCKYTSVNNNGWMTYSGDSGSYISSTILENSGSVNDFINFLSSDMYITYSAGKNNWAVRSGFWGDKIFYMKVVKTNGKFYVATFYVPKGDKKNSQVYNRLTERIFNSSNFPSF